MRDKWIILRDIAGVTAGYKRSFQQVIVHGISCDLLILAFSVALCTGDTDLKELLKHWCGCNLARNLAPHMVVPGSWNSLKFICFLNMTDWSVKCFGMVMTLVNICWCIYSYSGAVHFLKYIFIIFNAKFTLLSRATCSFYYFLSNENCKIPSALALDCLFSLFNVCRLGDIVNIYL